MSSPSVLDAVLEDPRQGLRSKLALQVPLVPLALSKRPPLTAPS